MVLGSLVKIGLPDLPKLGGGEGQLPLPLQFLRPCVDLRLKCVHDIRWLNGWVDEVLFAKLGPHLLERSPFSLEYSKRIMKLHT